MLAWRLGTRSAPLLRDGVSNRRLFISVPPTGVDWMAVGQTIEKNPAASVRGLKYSISKGKKARSKYDPGRHGSNEPRSVGPDNRMAAETGAMG